MNIYQIIITIILFLIIYGSIKIYNCILENNCKSKEETLVEIIITQPPKGCHT
jgi:hypothetical protein